MAQQTIDQEQIFENISNQNSWIRLVYMLIYGIMLHVAGGVMWLLCAVQFLCALIFGTDNDNVRKLSATLIDFINSALRFVSYNTEERPFPFAGKHDPRPKNKVANPPASNKQESGSGEIIEVEEPSTVDKSDKSTDNSGDTDNGKKPE